MNSKTTLKDSGKETTEKAVENVVENVVEDSVNETEEPHFTLTINVPQLPGKTQVLVSVPFYKCVFILYTNSDIYRQTQANLYKKLDNGSLTHRKHAYILVSHFVTKVNASMIIRNFKKKELLKIVN